jgi:hypothetical protein
LFLTGDSSCLPLTAGDLSVILKWAFTRPIFEGITPMRACVFCVMALFLTAASPQEKKGEKQPVPKEGLKAGMEFPSSFQPFNLNGKFKGRFHCLVCERALNPTVAVFVRGTDDLPGATLLLKGLDEAVKTKKNEKARLAAFAVFSDEALTDVVANDDKREDVAKKLDDMAAKLDRVVVSLESKSNLDKLLLNPDPEVVIVLYNKLKVVDVQSKARANLTKENIPAIVNDIVAKLVGKK